MVLVIDTAIYAAGDVLFATTKIPGAIYRNSGSSRVIGLTVRCYDDIAPVLNFVFLRSNVALGTINEAPSITDANADYVTGVAHILAADWLDLGGVRVAQTALCDGLLTQPIMAQAEDGTRDIYVAAYIVSGTPTFATAANINFDVWLSEETS